MELVKWNFDPNGLFSLPVSQLTVSSDGDTFSSSATVCQKRLLLLSHQLNYRGIPAFYMSQSPKYSTERLNQEVVLVFDFFSNFNQFQLPIWIKRFDFSISAELNSIPNEFFCHFQRALSLYYLYKFTNDYKLNVYYFDTFLLIESSEFFDEPFVFKPIPIIKNKKIHIRTIAAGNLKVVINPPMIGCELSENQFILMQPYPHPFFVKKIDQENNCVLLKNIDNTEIVKKIDDSFEHILLTKPPSNLTKFVPASNAETVDYYTKTKNLTSISKASSTFNFETTEFYTFDDKSFGNFFANNSVKDNEDTTQARSFSDINSLFNSENSYFFYEESSLVSLIKEEIIDKKERKVLYKFLSKFPNFPPPIINDMILPNSSFLSFFQFDLTFCCSEQPRYTNKFSTFSDINAQHLGLPNVKVNVNGNVRDVSPINIFDDWKKNHYSPISGPKSCHYVVFYVDYGNDYGKGKFDEINEENQNVYENYKRNLVIDYFESLQSSYTLHEFGTLSPFPKGESYISTKPSNFFEKTNSFFKKHTLAEYQQYPIISFVVCPIFFEQYMTCHSICTFLSTDQIKKFKPKDIDHMSFIVYSRIRLFHPYPFGMINIAPPEAASLFFGYRYQPPYLLSRQQGHALTIHLAWDPVTGFTAWVDDVGSVSHIFKEKPLPNLCKLLVDIVNFLKEISVDTTFTILSESPTDELVQSIISIFTRSLPSFSLFSIVPTPQIQIAHQKNDIIDISNQPHDDLIIFDDPETTLSYDANVSVPSCSCYIVSPDQPSYKISHYFNSKNDIPKKCIEEFAKNMSHLSWLSQSAETKKRVVSFPPHIAALLRRVRAKTNFITGFEFLPQ